MTWQKGQSGNPAGRPKGARNLLSESALKELISHWEENGRDTIDRAFGETREPNWSSLELVVAIEIH